VSPVNPALIFKVLEEYQSGVKLDLVEISARYLVLDGLKPPACVPESQLTVKLEAYTDVNVEYWVEATGATVKVTVEPKSRYADEAPMAFMPLTRA